jgi:hypothetical protein
MRCDLTTLTRNSRDEMMTVNGLREYFESKYPGLWGAYEASYGCYGVRAALHGKDSPLKPHDVASSACKVCQVACELGWVYLTEHLTALHLRHIASALEQDGRDNWSGLDAWRSLKEQQAALVAAMAQANRMKLHLQSGTIPCDRLKDCFICSASSRALGNTLVGAITQRQINLIHDAFHWSCSSPHPSGDD